MINPLQQADPVLINKAKQIKVIIADVDGVLTDGGIIYDNSGMELKKFNVKDGQIIQHLKRAGILVGAITGRKSDVVKNRCIELKFDFHYHGVKDKLEVFNRIKTDFKATNASIAYIGDDIIDLPILSICGLSAAPIDAVDYVKSTVDMVTAKKGGEGAFREFADFILTSQGKMDEIISYYQQKKDKN